MKESDAALKGTHPQGTTESALVDRAKARSSDAWSEIYQTHYPAIFRYVRARVFDETAAEDVAASVFVAALKSIDNYHYRGRPLLAWLYRIARNVVADYQRETHKQIESLGPARRLVSGVFGRRGDSSLEVAADSTADPAAMIQNLDVRRAIARLPSSQREVIILRFFVGLSAEEAAAVVSKNVAAVYSLQARAIVSLRKELV